MFHSNPFEIITPNIEADVGVNCSSIGLEDFMQLKQETDRIWLERINAARVSGLSDYAWCKENRIPVSTFYYNLRRLKKQAIEIREKQKLPSAAKQEVVKLDFAAAEQDVKVPDRTIDIVEASPANRTPAVKPEPVIRIRSGALTADIMSGADEWMIQSLVRALHQVC